MKKSTIVADFVKQLVCTKTFRIMRNTLLLLLLNVFQIFGNTSYSQSKILSLNLKDVSIKEALSDIEQNSEFFFLYNSKLIDVNKKVTLNAKNEKINRLLEEIFKGTNVKYVVFNRQIILTTDENLSGMRTQLQQKPVSGLVTDENKEPLPGVNVTVKGTTIGTITDASGKYILNNVPENSTLVFSFIGMTSQEISTEGRDMIDVVLQGEAIGLQEIVVIGYGTVKKGDLTGSVSSVSSSDFENQPVIRMEDVLKGRASGVEILKPNGAPGSGIKIRIRGANSINGNNDPLYVIDGLVGADIASLNPNDIETISVLKDASSTAIYGSRGANGVVLITTKTGKIGDASIHFDAFYSLDNISKTYDLLNGAQYMQIVNERNAALGVDPQFTDSEIAAVRASGGTDWQKEVFRTGGTQNYQLSFKGGTEKTQYYLSGTVADQEGIMINSNYKRYGLRSNINSKLSDKFNLAFTMYSTYEQARNNYNQNGRNNPAGTALIFPPNIPVWDETTNNYTISPPYGPIAGNPVFEAKETIYDSNKFSTLSNLRLYYHVTKYITLSVSGGANGYFYDNPYLKTAAPGTPISNTEAGHDNGNGWILQNTNSINYTRLFAEKHRIDVTAVYEQQVSTARTNGAWATGFPTIALGYDNLSLGSTRQVNSGYQNWALQSFLGRLNYAFNDKYLLTGTFRADGSSKFYGDNKYGYFPSGAFAWRLSNESFIQSMNIFSDLKLRASYGLVGSQAINPYKTLSLLALGKFYSFNGTTSQSIGIGPGISANPNLKWETTAQTDIGLDFGVLEGRISGTIDYYHKKTTDLLMDVSIPFYNGGGSLTQNVGSLENKGFEFLLSGVIMNRSDFRLSSNVNFSINRNKILDLGENKEIFTDGGYSGASYAAPPFILKVGEPLGQFRGLVSLGLWKSNEAAEAAEYGKVPGDSKYLDIDGNKSYGGEDMVNIGSAQPDFIWGWNTDFGYKNFDLTININGVHGNQVWNQTRWLMISMGADIKNPTSVEILNRWTPSHENTDVPGFSSSNTTYAQSSQFIEDGSFIRLSNVTLGYSFPQSILHNVLKEARIYVSAQNLFVITKYSGLDPQLTSTPIWSDVAQGIDNGTYPATRIFTFGLKVGF